MNLLKEVNVIRRRVTKGLTKNIGKTIDYTKYDPIDPLTVKRVLISRPNNRLGNQLMMTPLVQEVIDTFPNCTIDLFVRGTLSPIIFENYKEVETIYNLPKKPFKHLLGYFGVWIKLKSKKYDMVINVVQNSSSGRLSTKVARARYKFFGEKIELLEKQYKDYNHMAKNAIYNLRYYLNMLGIEDKKTAIPVLDIKVNDKELAQGNDLLAKLVKNDKKTIGIYTFATGEKCYSEEWWANVYDRLMQRFGTEYNIIEVLPVENVSQIAFKAPSYYSKDIREIAGFLQNLDLFICADSGMMHLGSAVASPLIGLFSVTDLNMYTPYGPDKIGIDTRKMSYDQIMDQVQQSLN